MGQPIAVLDNDLERQIEFLHAADDTARKALIRRLTELDDDARKPLVQHLVGLAFTEAGGTPTAPLQLLIDLAYLSDRTAQNALFSYALKLIDLARGDDQLAHNGPAICVLKGLAKVPTPLLQLLIDLTGRGIAEAGNVLFSHASAWLRASSTRRLGPREGKEAVRRRRDSGDVGQDASERVWTAFRDGHIKSVPQYDSCLKRHGGYAFQDAVREKNAKHNDENRIFRPTPPGRKPAGDKGGTLSKRKDSDRKRPEVSAIRRETQKKVRAAVDHLPEPKRSVLRLIDLEGYHLQDAAEKLGLTRTDVKNHLERGRKKLALLLKAMVQHDE